MSAVWIEQSTGRAVRTFQRGNSKAKSISFPLTLNRSLPWMMLAFADWSSTSSPGTHYHTIFQMLPYRSYTVLFKHTPLAMGVTAISFTTDIWTSVVRLMSMLSLTAQWVDKDFVLRKAVLLAQECAGSHTAAAI
jgi:hypothetical protein